MSYKTGWKGRYGRDKHGGYALIITLWVLVLLSMLAMTFNLSSRLSTAMVRNFKEETVANYLAVSGYNMVLREIMADRDRAVDFMDEEGRFYLDRESGPVPDTIHLPEGDVRVRVEDEEGRININHVSENILRLVLKNRGVDWEKQNELIDSLKDWIDPDDAHRLNGAEDEYYELLGYQAKNDRLDLLDELLLVKGFDRELVYGNDESPGLARYFTTFGTGGLNINTASRELMRLLGLGEIEIDTVMNQRTVTVGGYRMIPPRFTAAGFSRTSTMYFRVVVEATPAGSNISYRIESVLKRIPALKGYDLETLYWRENVLYSSSKAQ